MAGLGAGARARATSEARNRVAAFRQGLERAPFYVDRILKGEGPLTFRWRMVKRHIGAVIFTSDGYFNDHSEQIGALTQQHKLPAIYQVREFAAGGGLM